MPQHGELFGVMANLLLFFGIAGLVVPLLQRLRLSPVLGYLLCGVAIGPHSLGVVADGVPWLQSFAMREAEIVSILGEFGIIAMMFMIGLELSFTRLRELKHYVFGLGSLQVIITASAICAAAMLFGHSVNASILIGASLALSSTAIVMQLLEEKHTTNRPIGVLCFSILLFQDLAVVPILVLAGAMTGNASDNAFISIASSIAIGTLTVIAMYFVGRRIMRPLLHSVSISRNSEWLVAFTIFVIVACAGITQMSGLSMALGAFMAGLLIAETEFHHEVEVIIHPLKGILLGMFFLSVGMQIDLSILFAHPLSLLAGVVGIFAIKGVLHFPLFLLFKIPPRRAAEASIFLAQPGEFALLIIGVALTSKLLPAADGQFFLSVTAMAMLVTPLVFKLAPMMGEWANNLLPTPVIHDDPPLASENFVIIAGFGRVGQTIGSILEEQKIAYIAIENNAERVRKLRNQGFRVIYGDAKKISLWRKLHIGDALAAVVAIDDHSSTRSILNALKTQWPTIPVIIRAHDTPDMKRLYDLGAKHVVAETQESGLRIAKLLLGELGLGQRRIDPRLSGM